jgi:hypothetical protein
MDYRDVQELIAADRGALARLRAWPRGARFALLAAAVALEAAFFAIWFLRDDLAHYPRGRMVVLCAGYAGLALFAGWHALRPIYLPPARWASRLVLAAGLVWPLVVAALPEVPTTTHEPFTSHPANAYYCIVDGGGLAIALLLLARALDRGGHGVTDHALAAAVAAGAAGLFGLQLQCPFNYPLHLLLGHATIPALFLAGTLLFSRASR